MGQFAKGLSGKFIDALAELAQKEGWWQDVLKDKNLIIGIREEELDVYWHGQSIFNVDFKGGRVNVSTHIKYLLDPELSDQVSLKDDGIFAVNAKTIPILARYEGTGTLKKLKKAADLFSGKEKQGVHAIVCANENIIDVEVSLDARDLDTPQDRPRIDIAALERREEGTFELVFWEAKRFANKELKAADSAEPKVIKQVKAYEEAINARRSEIIQSYATVAKNLVQITEMSGGIRKVGPAIEKVAAGSAKLIIDSKPHVGVIIFGYDADQRAEDSIGQRHFKRLKEKLGAHFVRACGKPGDIKL